MTFSLKLYILAKMTKKYLTFGNFKEKSKRQDFQDSRHI